MPLIKEAFFFLCHCALFGKENRLEWSAFNRCSSHLPPLCTIGV